jgi:hypothetical protein
MRGVLVLVLLGHKMGLNRWVAFLLTQVMVEDWSATQERVLPVQPPGAVVAACIQVADKHQPLVPLAAFVSIM